MHLDETSFVVQHILEMKLFVRVAWVGPNLKWLADTLTAFYLNEKANRSLVLLSYVPSTITMWGNSKFMSVAFPPCETLQSSRSVGCKYELHRLVKLVWSRLEVGAKPAYEVKHSLLSKVHSDSSPTTKLLVIKMFHLQFHNSRDSSVGIALGYGLDDRVLGFDSRRGL
jgi:hypothetical protein